MTSSSRSVIKQWNPEVVRTFITPPVQSEPQVRELKHPMLDMPPEEETLQAENDETGFAGQTDEEELTAASEEIRLELEEAREEAAEILREAREEAERIRETARQEGFAQGQEEGRQSGMEQANREFAKVVSQQEQMVRDELTDAVRSIEEVKKRCLRSYLDELKECSIAVAEKVIHTSLETSGDIIKRMIVHETEKLKKTAWVKIYMEKLDYDMMMDADANLVTELSKVSDNIKFVVMEKEQRGSCIIETPEEIMDIGVETQLENIREIAGTIRA